MRLMIEITPRNKKEYKKYQYIDIVFIYSTSYKYYYMFTNKMRVREINV